MIPAASALQSPTDPYTLTVDLAQVRQHGETVSQSERIAGVSSFATAIPGSVGEAWAAVGLNLPNARWTAQRNHPRPYAAERLAGLKDLARSPVTLDR